MDGGPLTLEPGKVLDGRFVVAGVLGRGGFGIVYDAEDLRRGDLCVVKELAPYGSVRHSGGLLELPGDAGYKTRLRQQFLQEARNLGRLRCKGVPLVRSPFVENGTAYLATDSVPGAKTLETVLSEKGVFSGAEAVAIALDLLAVLEQVHRSGLLHRDIKPSNILLSEDGKPCLIDFGAAREWHADASSSQTVLYTPGYAPLEQLSQYGRRGPATDLYALCATLFHMLMGEPPPSAPDRASDARLPNLAAYRRDLDPAVLEAIESGLELQYERRPQSANELAARIREGVPSSHFRGEVEDFDERALALLSFRFDKRQCPGCGGVLDTVRPLKRGVCPVCREGVIRVRSIPEGLCPLCKSAPLKSVSNPIPVCPWCKTERTRAKRAGVVSRHWMFACPSCHLKLEEQHTGRAVVVEPGSSSLIPGEERAFGEWLQISGRSSSILACENCGSQFDSLEDGRWKQVCPKPSGAYQNLYPDEWARIAAGLDPAAGNAECDGCGAEFFLESELLTTLSAHRDPYQFVERHQGRCLDLEGVRWLAMGKSSPAPGLVCAQCSMEFDLVDKNLRLVRDETDRLVRCVGEIYDLEDWHRLGRDLPIRAKMPEFEERFDEALYRSYESGKLDFGGKTGCAWRGEGTWEVKSEAGKVWSGSGLVLVQGSTITFGRLFKKYEVALDSGLRISMVDDDALELSSPNTTVSFSVEPIALKVSLRSGNRLLELDTQNLLARLHHNSRHNS